MRYSSYILATVVLCGFLFWLRLGQPLYTDDVTYLMMSTRFLIEDGKYWWILPQCTGSVNFEIPALWKPFALVRSLAARHIFHFVVGLDLFVVARAALLILSTGVLVLKLQGRLEKKWNSASITSMALFFVGTVPLFLVHGRPESTILLLLVLSFTLHLRSIETRGHWVVFVPFVHVACFLWGITLHPQITAFLPFYLLLIAYSRRGMLAPKILAAALLLLTTAVSVPAWGHLFACPSVPKVDDYFRQWSVRPRDLATSVDAWSHSVKLFLELLWVPEFLSFREHYRLELLVNHQPVNQRLMQLTNFSSTVVEMLLAAIAIFYTLSLSFYRGLPDEQRHQLRAAAALLVSFGIWAAVRGKNPYTIPLIHGTLLLVFAAVAPIYRQHGQMRLLRDPFLRLLLSLSLLSAGCGVFVAGYSFGGFDRGFGPITPHRDVYDCSFPRTPEMLHPERYRAFIERCGLLDLPKHARVAIDETTFFLIPERPGLMLMMYVGKPFWLRFSDPLESLLSLGTEAYLLPCEDYPSLLKLSHQREGALCCGGFSQ